MSDQQESPRDTFDVIVVGAGPVGENVADYAHRDGLSVALVESHLAGGECSYWACVPSKAMLRPIQALAAARSVEGAREAVTGNIDVPAVLRRRDGFVGEYDDSAQVSWVEDIGVAFVRGHGRLHGERRVLVDEPGGSRMLTARRAVVMCTGSVPRVPSIDGLADVRWWTSHDATAMDEVPRRWAIVGGGVVACEMASVAQGLGAEGVTMLVRDDRLLRRLEPFAADAVHAGLSDSGVDIRFGVQVTSVRSAGDGSATDASAIDASAADGPVTIELDDGASLTVDRLLLATGRRPHTDDIGAETVGLTPGDPLRTDRGMGVTGVDGSWLFAAGDVTGEVPLTHQGKYQARLLGDRIVAEQQGRQPDLTEWGRHTPTADHVAVAQVIFTHPQVATVGLTQAQAAERNIPVEVLSYDLGSVAGAALHADGYAGQAMLVIDRARAVIIGATFAGPDVAELLHAATIAIVGEVPLGRLWHAVPAFPTVSEVWLRLLEARR